MKKYQRCVINPQTFPLWQAPDESRKVSPLIGADSCGVRELCTGLWSLTPGHKSEPDIHPDAAEVYFVVTGEGRLLLEDEEYTVRRGMTIDIPMGVKHQTFNTGSEDLCYYFLFCPSPSETPKFQEQNWNQLN